MITRQQIRAVLSDGGRVIDSAGHPVGRIVDVVLGMAASQPAWITVDCHLCPGVEVVVPLARARVLDGCLQVPYPAASVCDAPLAEGSAGGFDGPQRQKVRRYYADLDAGGPAWPDRPADRDTTAAPVPSPRGSGTPVATGNGHGRTNGASSATPLNARSGIPGLDALPALRELDVRTGDGSPAAYPPGSSGPWPPVSTSSPGPPWWERRQWRWPSVTASVREMRLELRPVLELTGLPDGELEDLILAAGEAAANAVEHAGLPGMLFFDVLAEVGEARARIVIQDHGRWRTPSAGGDRGRGLQMIGGLAESTLTVGSRGTTVVLCNLPGSSP